MRQPITIFEGPDCGGKSTAIGQFMGLNQVAPRPITIHHGPYKKITQGNQSRFYLESMLPALNGTCPVVLDRCWLSEPIYGRAFRNGEDRIGVTHRRHLDRIALSSSAIIVLCLPPFEKVLEKWAERKGDEYLEKEEQLEAVYRDYEQLHRQTDIPVMRYDYTDFDCGFGNGKEMDPLRSPAHRQAIKTVGNWHAPIILVGDEQSEPTNQDLMWRAPFCSFASNGSSAWLTEQLEDAGIPESKLMWLNSSIGDLGWLTSHAPKSVVVALGDNASDRLTKAKVRHQKFPHPQYQRRFKSGQEYELLAFIKEYL